MRLLRVATVTAITLLLVGSHSMSASALSPTESPTVPAKSPLKVSAYAISLQQSPRSDDPTKLEYVERPQYIELINDSNQPVDPAEYSLRVTDTHGAVLVDAAIEKPGVTGYIEPGQFITLSFNGAVEGVTFDLSTSPAEFHYLTKPSTSQLDREFQLFRGGVGVYAKAVKLKLDNPEPQTRLVFMTVTAEEQANEARVVYDGPLYVPRHGFSLAPIEILANPSNCAPFDVSASCKEYVKFYNAGPSKVDFDGTRLRVGYLGQASTAQNTTALSGEVGPNQYAYFTVDITNSGGYVWLEDVYGVLPYENTVVAYPDASSTTKKGKSWALIDGTWQWAVPNPAGQNTGLPQGTERGSASERTLMPCRANQFRNPETNRCKRVDSTASSLTPCASNQYRNPETNRCRLVGGSASSGLKPCETNQFRNPDTNRCKSLVATASSLKPCEKDQERNPTTNRCRKSTASMMPLADFPIERNASTDQTDSLGWVAFAGVGALAAGYGGWEWRYEIANLFRKLKRLVTKQ